MNASKYVKSHGFSTLKQVADIACVGTQQLTRWHKTKPVVFELILKGIKYDKARELLNEFDT